MRIASGDPPLKDSALRPGFPDYWITGTYDTANRSEIFKESWSYATWHNLAQ
jgi:hypothetical protein